MISRTQSYSLIDDDPDETGGWLAGSVLALSLKDLSFRK